MAFSRYTVELKDEIDTRSLTGNQFVIVMIIVLYVSR